MKKFRSVEMQMAYENGDIENGLQWRMEIKQRCI